MLMRILMEQGKCRMLVYFNKVDLKEETEHKDMQVYQEMLD